MNISVLGCGRWGSFLAWYNAQIGHAVISYGQAGSKSYEVLKQTGRNEWVELDPRIELSCDLERSIRHADIIIISISAQGLRGFFQKIMQHDVQNKKLVLCMKGIEEVTGKRLSEVAIESGIARENIAVWVGPGHIQEFTRGRPNCMVIDSYHETLTEQLIHTFKGNLIRFYQGNDMIGTELGAATKNIMGIVAGVLDGLELSTMKGALMARGSREVARLIHALGGNQFSAYGLCHLGDYETTLFSAHSHNRKWGEWYVQGRQFDKLAEGVPTAKAIAALARKIGADVPITDAVNTMIQHKTDPKDLLAQLFERSIKKEFYL